MWTLTIVVCCFISLAAGQDGPGYNCITSPCLNGGICDPPAYETCGTDGNPGVCPSGFYGYNCESTQDADPTCSAGGVCDGGHAFSCDGATCFCEENYFRNDDDPLCTEPRIYAVCNVDGEEKMDIFVAPHEGASFAPTGSIKRLDRDDDFAIVDGCAMTADAGSPPVQQYVGGALEADSVFSLRGLSYTTDEEPVGCARAEQVTDLGGEITYRAAFIIQYVDGARGESYSFEVACPLQAAGGNEVVLSIQFEGDLSTDDTAPGDIYSQVLDSGVTWMVTDASDTTAPLDMANPIVLSTEIAIVILLDTTVSSTQIGLWGLVVSNFPLNEPLGPLDNADDGLRADLYEDGCPVRRFGRVLTGTTETVDTGANTVEIVVNFRAFSFPHQAAPYNDPTYPVNTNWISVTLVTSAGSGNRPNDGVGTDSCETHNGDLYFEGVAFYDTVLDVAGVGRRKRRQVDTVGEISESIDGSIAVLIVDPNTPVTIGGDRETDVDSDDKSCHQSLTFLIPIVLLGLLLLVAIAMAFFFCMKLSRSQHHHPEANVNMAYKS